MCEIIVVVVLYSSSLATLATDIKYQLYEAGLMHEASLRFTLLIQLILETPHCFPYRLIYKAPVYQF